ncbi:ABC transporter AbcH.3 [Balamuthia mandrillaris]
MWRVGCGLSRGPCAASPAAVPRCAHNIASPAFPLFVKRSTSTTNLGNVAVRSSSSNRLGGATSPSPSPTPNPRRFLCFSDLHFRAPALSRAVEVLGRVRGLASGWMSPGGGQAAPNLATAGSEVVFLGDFFHHRNVVMVPHIDILMREFQLWYEQGVRAVFIPGNHDQVSLDGKVHALSLLSAFPNIRVATEPLLDREDRVAFLPWREEAESQTRLFKMLREEQEKCDQRPWTIFAHAEVGGSVSNGGHLVKGRVNRTDIEAVSRACYLGHFHKRQQIGDRIWYLGSPFQQNFGEAGQPKGVAVISLDRVEPQFVDWDDMPRHHIINYTPDDLQGFSSRASHVRSDDYVKVLVSSAHVGSSQLAEWLSGLSGAHVQLAVDPTLPEVAETAVEIPRGAMTEQLSGSLLNDILHRYVAKHTTSGRDEERREILRHGLELLSLVPDSQRQIVPLGKVKESAYQCPFLRVKASSFDPDRTPASIRSLFRKILTPTHS